MEACNAGAEISAADMSFAQNIQLLSEASSLEEVERGEWMMKFAQPE